MDYYSIDLLLASYRTVDLVFEEGFMVPLYVLNGEVVGQLRYQDFESKNLESKNDRDSKNQNVFDSQDISLKDDNDLANTNDVDNLPFSSSNSSTGDQIFLRDSVSLPFFQSQFFLSHNLCRFKSPYIVNTNVVNGLRACAGRVKMEDGFWLWISLLLAYSEGDQDLSMNSTRNFLTSGLGFDQISVNSFFIRALGNRLAYVIFKNRMFENMRFLEDWLVDLECEEKVVMRIGWKVFMNYQ